MSNGACIYIMNQGRTFTKLGLFCLFIFLIVSTTEIVVYSSIQAYHDFSIINSIAN